MEDDIKRKLLSMFDTKAIEEKKLREKAAIKTEQLSVLSGFISSLEESTDNLKKYSREWIEKVLEQYYSKEDLKELLDKLEIPTLAILMRSQGISIDFNEEENTILETFQSDLQTLYNHEAKKFSEEIVGGVKAVDKRISDLNTLYAKLNAGGTGKDIVKKSEIDYVMKLTTQENTSMDTQIEILGMINRINLQIYKNNLIKLIVESRKDRSYEKNR